MFFYIQYLQRLRNEKTAHKMGPTRLHMNFFLKAQKQGGEYLNQASKLIY